MGLVIQEPEFKLFQWNFYHGKEIKFKLEGKSSYPSFELTEEKKVKSEVKSKGIETFFLSYPGSSYQDSTVLYSNLKIIIWFAKNGSCSSKNKYKAMCLGPTSHNVWYFKLY